ncbi:hypothetical protein RIF29_00615 [Crotalaria pallida]|uniref:Uncharacterized protein n=1 Tax=Crotalaria pallida TaxID=3830 RepID=A0AAN9P7J4_CROPI
MGKKITVDSVTFSIRVMCNCGSCGSRKQTLSEWEKHTGCRAKKWKHSVKVKSTMLPLEKWIIEHISKDGVPPQQLDQQQVLAFLQEKYEPVHAKWTTERCAVCRWVEDWEDNKMIICNRVSEFAKLTPMQLLKETEKAVGDPQLPEQHRALVEKSRALKQIELSVEKNEVTLNQLKELNAELEKDVERVRQRDELLAKG